MKKRINPMSREWWACSLRWSFHNMIAHPISDLFYWAAVFFLPLREPLLRCADWVHDATVPPVPAREIEAPQVESISGLSLPRLREDMAAEAHNSWSRWMEYLFSRAFDNPDGSVTIPSELVERWRRQMDTPYEDLSEAERASDRREADRFIEAVRGEVAFGAPSSGPDFKRPDSLVFLEQILLELEHDPYAEDWRLEPVMDSLRAELGVRRPPDEEGRAA